MRPSVRIVTLVVVLATVLVACPAASSLSWDETQESPGMTVRTIWDTSQVACYKLPSGVNHVGNIHLELTFTPATADFDLYLLDANGNTLSEEMGYMAPAPGLELLDYRVTQVVDQTIETGDPLTPDDDFMVGDTYYVVVVAFGDTAQFQLWGYYPQIRLDQSTSTTNPWNYYLRLWRRPSDPGEWQTLHGPVQGEPYDFTPTSVGSAECRLEWPADAESEVVTYDPVSAPSPANMEQYLFTRDETYWVFEDYGDANWIPQPHGTPPETWYGLFHSYSVSPDGETAVPHRTLRYVPSLFLVASDPVLGRFAPPRLGVSTSGYKATLVYPQNLTMTGPTFVHRGRQAVLSGRFALNGSWTSPGTTVNVQRLGPGGWVQVTEASVGADGRWSTTVTPAASTSWRAWAIGDMATGPPYELSLELQIAVIRKRG